MRSLPVYSFPTSEAGVELLSAAAVGKPRFCMVPWLIKHPAGSWYAYALVFRGRGPHSGRRAGSRASLVP